MSIFLSILGFVTCLLMGRVSIAAGLGSVLTWGYLYGILRANFPDSLAHFIFDAAVLGFYASFFVGLPRAAKNPRTKPLLTWVVVLIGWSLIMSMIPIQHYLIQLVGLRGNGFLLPFLLVGSWMSRDDADKVAVWLAVLNMMAFGFAVAEFFLSVQAFYPHNAVTELIYASADVAGSSLRIPSCFANAHSFGGAMVLSLPWLLGAWVQPRKSTGHWLLLSTAIVVAIIGIFMSAARTHVLLLGFLVIVTTFSGKLRGGFWLSWIVLIIGVGYVISNEERLQRFTSLADTDAVANRLEGSINVHFFELLATYPLGNGMGAGGTSIPFFLMRYMSNPIGMENEYCRILLEQGLPGLMLWLGFICWIATRRPLDARDPWQFGKLLMWFASLALFVNALTGIGLMTAIPQSTMLFLGVGFATNPVVLRRRAQNPSSGRMPALPAHAYRAGFRGK
jgi:hypothetical protein